MKRIRTGRVPRRKSPQSQRLSDRQIEVMKLMVRGLNRAQTAKELGIAEYTVHEHIKNIYQRLGVNNRVLAVAEAIERGIGAEHGPSRGWTCRYCGCRQDAGTKAPLAA